MKIYAVIDTNVIISALLSHHQDSATVKILDCLYDRIIVPVQEYSYLVTGNTKHFPKKPFVVTPAEMLQIIQEMKSPKNGILSEPSIRYGKK